MIISHLHRYIFTAVPKTGTHAVRRSLRQHLGPADIEQVGLFVQKVFPFAPLAELRHGHISLSQIRPFLPADDFESYFKFAFVRNPFDRFVSYCAFMTRDDGAFERDPKRVMRHFLFEDRPMDHLLFHPQHTFVSDESGKLAADYVGRVESLQSSYDAVCAHLGMPAAVLEKVNASVRADYRSYYDANLVDAVSKLYQRDIELFGYSFEGSVS